MGEDLRLRALDPERDRALLERLWAAALGPVWPLLPGALELLQDGLVAERAEHGWALSPSTRPGAFRYCSSIRPTSAGVSARGCCRPA